jgi:TP901 family phage tail tape measure protein
MQQNLINSINATGKFSAQMRTIKTSTESFTNALEKNKFSMGEYFRYAGGASKTFGRLFKTEFDTINKVARENVKDLQTQYVKLGRDASGSMKAISVRPLSLDMNDLATKTMIASERQALLNQLLKQGSTNLLNFGKNTQWAGRQLMVGFTLPLMAVGSAAAKTFMDMETQAIRFKKVYGDLFTPASETQAALDGITELGKEFTKYGIAVSSTVGLASEAAAAGFQGLDLQRQTTAATKLSILGQVESQKALETTIALQNAFSMSSANLAESIDFLNAVENQTVLSLDDMSTAIPKAAPVVQQLGGDVKDLAFLMTAMKEGGINASEGANALKSGLASLINPTGKANDMLLSFGINAKKIVEDNRGDLKKTVIDFASALNQLDPLNRAQVIEQMFGKFQFARLSTLFANVTKEGTQAARVLDLAGASVQELAALSEKELGMTSESAMNKFKGAVEDLKLSLVPVGEEFLKAVTPIAEFVTKILDKFNNLGDGTKKAIVTITAVVAGLGPVVLMTFGLLANGIANIIKGFTLVKSVFNKTGQSTATLGTQVEYMTLEQRNAAAVAASLDQVHRNLAQTFTSEAAAVDALTRAYARAIAKQSQFGATGVIPGRGAPKKFAKGRPYVVGGTGRKDSEPAMLMPGETVLPTDMSKKYAGLINGIIADNIPGYAQGKGSVKGKLFGYEGSFSRERSIEAISSRFEGLDAAVQDEIAGVIPDIMESLNGTSISLETFSNEIKKRIDEGVLEIRKSQIGGFGDEKTSAAPTAIAKRKQSMTPWDTRAEELAAKKAIAEKHGLTPTQAQEIGYYADSSSGMSGTSVAHLEPKDPGLPKDWSTRTATGGARLQAEDTAINAYLNDLTTIKEEYVKKTRDFVSTIVTEEEKKDGVIDRLLSGKQPRNKREYDILAQVAERDLQTRGTPESITGRDKSKGYRAEVAASAAKIRTKSKTYFAPDGSINPEYQEFDPKKSAKAAVDRGKQDAESYEKGKKKGKIKDPYITSTEDSRKSPHPKAGKDGRDDAKSYNDEFEKESKKRTRKRTRSSSRRRVSTRPQGPAPIGAIMPEGATQLAIVPPLTAEEKRKDRRQKQKTKLLGKTKAVGSKLGTRLGGGTALLGANMALSAVPDFAGKELVQSTMTGANLGMLFGPWGAAAGAAIGLVSNAIGNLIEKQRQHKAMNEAVFKSSADLATFFGNAVVDTELKVGSFTSSLGIVGQKAENLGKSFGYTNEELKAFVDLIASLPENNPLKDVVDGLANEDNPEKIKKVAEAFVTTQVALGQIKPEQAQKTLDLILSASGHANMVGSVFMNLKTQVDAISASLNNAKNNSTALGTSMTQLIGAASNATSLEQLTLILDGIAASGISAASALSSMYYAYLQVGNLEAAGAVEVLQRVSGITAKQSALVLTAITKGFKTAVNAGTNAKKLAADAEKFLRDPKLWKTDKPGATTRDYQGEAKVGSLKKEIDLLKQKKKIIDDQIKKEQQISDQLKKQNDYRAKQASLDKQIIEAKIRGNYIDAANLLQEKQSNTAEFNQANKVSGLQSQSDALQAQIDKLQASSDKVVSAVNATTAAVTNGASAVVSAIGGISFEGGDGSSKSKAISIPTSKEAIETYVEQKRPKMGSAPKANPIYMSSATKNIDAAAAFNKGDTYRFEQYVRSQNSVKNALNNLENPEDGIVVSAVGSNGKTYTFRVTKGGDFIRVGESKGRATKTSGVGGRAEGGMIRGAGTGTSDSIPAYLSNGEYVIKADSVKKYGVGTFDALNAQKFKKGGRARLPGSHVSSSKINRTFVTPTQIDEMISSRGMDLNKFKNNNKVLPKNITPELISKIMSKKAKPGSLISYQQMAIRAMMGSGRSKEFMTSNLNAATAMRMPNWNLPGKYAQLAGDMAASGRTKDFIREKLGLSSSTFVPGLKNGGLIKGPGTGRSDSIRASLGYAGGGAINVSNGEFVVKASSVKDYGIRKMNAINNGTANVDTNSGSTVYNINMPITANQSDPKAVGDYVIKQLKLVVDKNNKGNSVRY